LDIEKKEKEELEQHLSKVQEEQGQAVIDLHKKLGKHVHDMHAWKDFLEQDKEYDSVDLHITMAEELEGEAFDQKISTVEGAFTEETDILAKLLKERKPGSGSANVGLTASSEGDKSSKRKDAKSKK